MPVHPRVAALSPPHPSIARSSSSSSSGATGASGSGSGSAVAAASNNSMRPPPPPAFTSALSSSSSSAANTSGGSQTQTIDAPFSAPNRPKSAGSHRHAPYPTTSISFGSSGGTSGAGVPGPSGSISPTGTGGSAAGRSPSTGGASTGVGVGIGVGASSPVAGPTSPTSLHAAPSAAMPYMVALSGWPEPVYVDSALGGRKGDGGRDSFDMGQGDGWNPSAAVGGDSYGTYGHAHSHGRFADPRFKGNVSVMHNRGALAVAPGWGSDSPGGGTATAGASMGGLPGMSGMTATASASASASPALSNGTAVNGHAGAVGTGVKVPLGNRGDGLLVMRAVPEVYPLPGSSPTRTSALPQGHGQRTSISGGTPSTIDPLAFIGSAPEKLKLRQPRSPPVESASGSKSPTHSSFPEHKPEGGPNGDKDIGVTGAGAVGEGHEHSIAKHPGMHAHPLARMSLPGMLGVATEVYPRDPDNGILWRNVTNGLAAQRAAGGDGKSSSPGDKDDAGHGHAHGQAHGHGRDDHIASSNAILSAPTPRAGDGWSPTVPWAATPMGQGQGTKSAVGTPTPTKIRVKFKGDVVRLKEEEGGGGRSSKKGTIDGDVDMDEEKGKEEDETRDKDKDKDRDGKRDKGKKVEEPMRVSRTREEDGEMDVDI